VANDVITDIRSRIIAMIGAMTIEGGYNFDYDATSINTNDWDLAQAFQSGDSLDDIFPIVEIRVLDERPLFNPDTGVNGNIALNDRDFEITIYPLSTMENLDNQLNKCSEDLKKLFFADYDLRGTILESSTPKCRQAYYAGEVRVESNSNLKKCAGAIIWTLTVRYGQDIDSVRTLT